MRVKPAPGRPPTSARRTIGIAGLLLAIASTAALAQATLEVIQLRNRPAEQVIPILRPLLEPGGALSGQNFQLIVRTSPRNLAEIRKVLASIDAPARRLVISVRFDSTAESARDGVAASARIRAGGNPAAPDASRVDVRIVDSRSSRDERVDQRIQVLEGGRAFISTGEARPVRQREVVRTPQGTLTRESTVMQEVSTGFEVVPRVSGDIVLLEISPQRQAFDSAPAGQRPSDVTSQQASTTASGRLGEWFELGGAGGASARDERGILSTVQARSSESRSIWVRVDEVRP
jgi:type II secretory pathway component GspD/PulD (secretin)